MTNAYMHRGTGLIVNLEPDPSGLIVAYVPALPGCVSQGDTISEALGNIDDAIEGVLSVMQEDGLVGGLSIHHEPWDEIEHTTGTGTLAA